MSKCYFLNLTENEFLLIREVITEFENAVRSDSCLVSAGRILDVRNLFSKIIKTQPFTDMDYSKTRDTTVEFKKFLRKERSVWAKNIVKRCLREIRSKLKQRGEERNG